MRRAFGANSELAEDLRNLRLLDVTEGGRRFVLLVPRYLAPAQRLPLVVLLHGLGETTNERLGAYAWLEKYGLGSAWQRLKRPPIERTSTRGEWTDARLDEVNAELAKRPFRGFVMACPFMPNPSGPSDLDAYARWIERSLLPRARAESNALDDAAHTYLAGVSLGGYVALEMLVRMPHAFGAWAGVQTAIGTWAAPGYAEKLAQAWQPTSSSSSARPMLILTSTQDQWRTSSEALERALRAKNIPSTYRVIPGPHDQPWLREAGTIETLLWLDRLS
ncbi:putative esterase [Labilithrix luteola]|uniref:Putative esterase n=1 Tax=Labilithrix luteola TaxID=1391654 RepID=A0A0K1QED5_9BACT|nr:alpha/beta hydrolase-fold protein [Labilithrix luteola]AKV04093.1 putative esterase [Labilithrix luteola]